TRAPAASLHSNVRGSPSGSAAVPTRLTDPPSSAVLSGPASAVGGRSIVKTTSLTSLTLPPVHVTRARAWAVLGPLTVQSKCPVVAVAFGTEAASVANVAPPSRDSSTRTKVSRPRLCVQVKDCVVPGAQVTAVFGAVTRMVAGTIEKLDSPKPVLPL